MLKGGNGLHRIHYDIVLYSCVYIVGAVFGVLV